MRKAYKAFAVAAVFFACVCLSFFGCAEEKRYALTVIGADLLCESLNDTYAAGEEISFKVKINPREGAKALLDSYILDKKANGDYWEFTGVMPAHDATLEIRTYEGMGEPLLYGFFVTFIGKDGKPIDELNKSLESDGAVAKYSVPHSDANGEESYVKNSGADVFADGRESAESGAYSLENTLYFTYELLGATARADGVYFDEERKEIFSRSVSSGHFLTDIGFSATFYEQHLSDMKFDSDMNGYEEKFDSSVKLNIRYIDYLTSVKLTEYDADGEAIKVTAVANTGSEIVYTAGKNCAYVVLEEEYTAMTDASHDKGKTYSESTRINKTDSAVARTLKFPRGNGLIFPLRLTVTWEKSSAD